MKNEDLDQLGDEKRILNIENQELKMQIKKLKSQFEEALKINDQLEDSFKKNAELSKELNQCESEKADFIKRLDIANKNIQDLEQKLRNRPTLTSTEIKYEIDNTEILRLQEKIKVLESNLSQKEQMIKTSTENNRTLEGEINKVYKAATQTFGQNVSCTSELLPLFAKCKQPQIFPNLDLEITRYKAKTEKWKQKYELEKELREKLETAPPQVQRDSAMQTFTQKEEYTKLINQLKQSNSILSKKNDDLTRENERILTESSQLTAQIRILKLQLDDNQNTENAKHSEKLATLSAELLTVKEENGKIKCQLHEICRRYKSATQELSEIRSSKIETEKTIKDLNNKIEVAEDNKDKLKHQIKNLQKKLQKAEKSFEEAKEEKTKMEMHLQNAETDAKRFKASSEALETSLMELRAELEKEQSLTARLKLEIDEKSAESARFEKVSNSLREQLESSKTRFQPVPSNQTRAPEISPSSFVVKEMPEDLASIIREIARQQIPIAAKVSQCLSAAISFYAGQVAEAGRRAEEERAKRAKMEEDLKVGAEFLSRKLCLDLDFTKLRDDRVRDSFSEFVTAERQKTADLQSKLRQNEAKVEELIRVPEELRRIQRASNKQKRIIKELKSIIVQQEEESKKALKEIEDEFNNVSQICTNQESSINLYKSEIEKLQNEIKTKTEENDLLNSKLQSLQNEFESNKREYESTVSELNKESKELEGKIEILISSKTKLEEENEALIKEMNSAKEEIEKLKKNVEDRNAEADELAAHVRKISKEKKRLIKKHKSELKENESKILEQIKKGTEEASKLIKELRESLEKTESENTQLRSEVEEKSLHIKKMEMTSAAAAKDYSREFKQSEAKWMARNKALEASFEAEHNKLTKIVSALNVVRPLLATGESLSEDGIEIALSNLRARFDLLIGRENRIRGMLKIGPNQSIEDLILRKFN